MEKGEAEKQEGNEVQVEKTKGGEDQAKEKEKAEDGKEEHENDVYKYESYGDMYDPEDEWDAMILDERPTEEVEKAWAENLEADLKFGPVEKHEEYCKRSNEVWESIERSRGYRAQHLALEAKLSAMRTLPKFPSPPSDK